jgi:hypothetical protein
MGGNGVPVEGVPNDGGNAASHISAPFKTASNNGLDLEPSNKRCNDDYGGLSKSRKRFAIEPTV